MKRRGFLQALGLGAVALPPAVIEIAKKAKKKKPKKNKEQLDNPDFTPRADGTGWNGVQTVVVDGRKFQLTELNFPKPDRMEVSDNTGDHKYILTSPRRWTAKLIGEPSLGVGREVNLKILPDLWSDPHWEGQGWITSMEFGPGHNVTYEIEGSGQLIQNS